MAPAGEMVGAVQVYNVPVGTTSGAVFVGVVVKVVVNVAWLLLQLEIFLDLTDGEGCLCLTF